VGEILIRYTNLEGEKEIIQDGVEYVVLSPLMILLSRSNDLFHQPDFRADPSHETQGIVLLGFNYLLGAHVTRLLNTVPQDGMGVRR
jgi:hypothetical protein